MSDDFGIAGKTALVTGSARNIGRAIVLELAGRGAKPASHASIVSQPAKIAELILAATVAVNA